MQRGPQKWRVVGFESVSWKTVALVLGGVATGAYVFRSELDNGVRMLRTGITVRHRR